MRKKNAPKVLLMFILALALTVPFLTATLSASADQFSGAIYTSTATGTTVNQNVYDDRCNVYLNGGPQNQNGNGLPDGTYYFEVTDPSGATLLSTDNAVNRQLNVIGGVVAGTAGTHPNGTFNPASGSTAVQLCPFDYTPNAGGEYKVALIRQTADTTIDPDDPRVLHYREPDSKTDNFKVKVNPPPPPQSAIGGVKYDDTNANGMLDPGETGIEGVQIKVTLSDNTMVTTATDSTGTWALVFPVGTNYTVCEVLPNNTTYTQTGPKSGAQTVDGSATANAAMCWAGTVLSTNTSDLNFFNLTCTPQITCPQNIVQCNDASKCTAVVTYDMPTATDNCGGSPTVACDPVPGSIFQKGATTVTCTATDPHEQTAQCTFTVTVNDCDPPQIACPNNLVRCNEATKCSAVVSYTTPTATDNCGSATVVCDPASGATFQKGTTTVTCAASDTATPPNTSSCTFTVTVNDCEDPKITCPTIAPIQLYPGDQCPTVVNFEASASDNCAIQSVACAPPSGSTFPAGVTTVNCTATDTAGRTASCSFQITVYTSIRAHKFYDANTNGSQGQGEPPIGGWKFRLGAATQFTDSNGNTTFTGLLPGSYTVTEVFPGSSWQSTTGGTSQTVNLGCPAVVNFGNVCILTPGGLTIGYWGNKNGMGVITGGDLCYLNGLCLRNATSSFDPVAGCPAPSNSQVSAGKTSFERWLQAANATNMAYMLSAQLSATVLNTAHGITNPNVIVDGNRTVAQELDYANSLLCGNGPCSGYNGNSTPAGPCRTEQERVKNILDKINNGGSFVQPAPCSFTTPY
jgi:HYR domain/SdrD B-like domain